MVSGKIIQIPLFVERGRSAPADPPRTQSRYDAVSDPEAAEIGHALLAQLRDEPLTFTQQALLAQAESDAREDRRAPTPVIDESHTLLSLGREDGAEVRVSFRRYKGSAPFLDIRRWEKVAGKGSGELRPTRQGVTIRAKELPGFARTMAQAVRRFAGG